MAPVASQHPQHPLASLHAGETTTSLSSPKALRVLCRAGLLPWSCAFCTCLMPQWLRLSLHPEIVQGPGRYQGQLFW